jgi:hypothetical protein
VEVGAGEEESLGGEEWPLKSFLSEESGEGERELR